MIHYGVTGIYFFRTATFEAKRGDVFLAEKPENGFRVFVQDASTAESFPYGVKGFFLCQLNSR